MDDRRIPVDLMPIDERILGFSNRWYRLLFDEAITLELRHQTTVRIAAPAMLLATRLEAFLDRGLVDSTPSHDLTDIVTIVNGHPSILEEVRRLPFAVRTFVRTSIVRTTDLGVLLHAHLPPDDVSQDHVDVVIARLTDLATD